MKNYVFHTKCKVSWLLKCLLVNRKEPTMATHNISKRTYKKNPFLTIVTRCLPSKRPVTTEIMEASIDNQTDKDIEHVYIEDTVGLGMFGANKSLKLAIPFVEGQYVHILDDDDYFSNMNFVEEMKSIASRWNPDIIIFKGFIDTNSPYGKEYPPKHVWGKHPKPATIGSFNFILKKELWKEYIHFFGVKSMGDFNMINELFKRHQQNLPFKEYWHDKLQVATYQIGRGGKNNK